MRARAPATSATSYSSGNCESVVVGGWATSHPQDGCISAPDNPSPNVYHTNTDQHNLRTPMHLSNHDTPKNMPFAGPTTTVKHYLQHHNIVVVFRFQSRQTHRLCICCSCVEPHVHSRRGWAPCYGNKRLVMMVHTTTLPTLRCATHQEVLLLLK